jgi:hypothetical protein
MRKITQKMIIYLLVGMLQLGIASSTALAAPNYDRHPEPREQQEPNQHDKERQDRERQEKVRHEQEMRRHPGENERDWHERQRLENERHEQSMREIGLGVAALLLILGGR